MTDSSRTLPEDSKPIIIPEELVVTRKPRTENGPLSNGLTNGTTHVNGSGTKRKRDADDAGINQDPIAKRGKVHEEATKYDSDPVFLEDSGNGAIVIDDD